jgi:hypothetical protein
MTIVGLFGSVRVQGPCFDCFGVGTAVSGVAQATGNVIAAEKQAGAARDAAKLAADAATHGADLQDAAAQRTEAFNREQADYTAQQAEVDRHANYDQYAVNRRRIGSLGTMLGLGGVDVPAYVPGIVPHFANAPAPAPGAPPSSGSPTPPDVQSPANFGAAMAGGARAAAAIAPPGAPPVNPALMAGNTGFEGGMATPQLQPDGTYAMVPSMPPRYRSFGQSLGVA